jgi:hypothetical protein
MQNPIKLENISNLITSPSSYQCRKTTVNMKVSAFCYYCLGTGVRASGEFAHTYCTCQNCKIIGKVKMESTGM